MRDRDDKRCHNNKHNDKELDKKKWYLYEIFISNIGINIIASSLTLINQNPLCIQALIPLLVVTPNVIKNMVTKNMVMENEIL